MITQSMKVYIEYKRGAEGFTSKWVKARMLTSNVDGTLRFESAIRKKRLMAEFKPENVTSFTIIKIAEPHTFINPVAGNLITTEVNTGLTRSTVNFPVIQLKQSAAGGEELIRIRGAGRPQRKRTLAIARNIAAALAANGYPGTLPDLSNESMWRVPRAQKIIGFALTVLGLVIVVLTILLVIYFPR